MIEIVIIKSILETITKIVLKRIAKVITKQTIKFYITHETDNPRPHVFESTSDLIGFVKEDAWGKKWYAYTGKLWPRYPIENIT